MAGGMGGNGTEKLDQSGIEEISSSPIDNIFSVIRDNQDIQSIINIININGLLSVIVDLSDYEYIRFISYFILKSYSQFSEALDFIQTLRLLFEQRGKPIHEFITMVYANVLTIKQGPTRFGIKYQRDYFLEDYKVYLLLRDGCELSQEEFENLSPISRYRYELLFESRQQSKLELSETAKLELDGIFSLIFYQIGLSEQGERIYHSFGKPEDRRMTEITRRFTEENLPDEERKQLNAELIDKRIKRLRVNANRFWYLKMRVLKKFQKHYMDIMIYLKDPNKNIDVKKILLDMRDVPENDESYLETVNQIVGKSMYDMLGISESNFESCKLKINEKLNLCFSAGEQGEELKIPYTILDMVVLINLAMKKYGELDELQKLIIKMFINIFVQYVFSKKLQLELENIIKNKLEYKGEMDFIPKNTPDLIDLINLLNIEGLEDEYDKNPEGKYIKYMIDVIKGTTDEGIAHFYNIIDSNQEYSIQDLFSYMIEYLPKTMVGFVENEAFYDSIRENPLYIGDNDLLQLPLDALRKVDIYYSQEYPYHTGRTLKFVKTIFNIVFDELSRNEIFYRDNYPDFYEDFMAIDKVGLFSGAAFHDLGKVKVKWEVLMRKGSLPDEYWEEMKKHSRYGEVIFREFQGLCGDTKFSENTAQYIIDVMKLHHVFRNIPLFVRLITIGDSGDSIMGRTYTSMKKSVEFLIFELIRCHGISQQFHDIVVKIMFKDIIKGDMSFFLKEIEALYKVSPSRDFIKMLSSCSSDDTGDVRNRLKDMIQDSCGQDISDEKMTQFINRLKSILDTSDK